MSDELFEILDKARRYFMQQEDLFGNVAYEGKKPGRQSPHPLAPPTTEPWASAGSLEDLNRQICECQKCPLGSTRTNFVLGATVILRLSGQLTLK